MDIQLEKYPQDKTQEYILGIDEAGRGPVLGPMVYATAFYPKSTQQKLKRFGVADSKVLNENQRDTSFNKLKVAEDVGFCVEILDSEELSKKMLRMYNILKYH
jgi:ribonuclease H2 subunit A